MGRAAMSQTCVQGVYVGGEAVEATGRLRMLIRPAQVDLTLLPQTGQTLLRSSVLLVQAGELRGAEVLDGTSGGGAVRSPFDQLRPPRLPLAPGSGG